MKLLMLDYKSYVLYKFLDSHTVSCERVQISSSLVQKFQLICSFFSSSSLASGYADWIKTSLYKKKEITGCE